MQTVAGHLEPWQAAFAISGVPGLLLAWFAFLLPEARRVSTNATQRVLKPLVELLAQRPAVMAAQFLGFSMNSLMGYSLMAWAPTFMGRKFGWHSAEIGSALGLAFGLSGAIATLGSGIAVDRLWTKGVRGGHYLFASVALAIATPAAAIAFVGASPWIFLAGVFIIYFASALCLNMGATALQLLTPPALRGRLSGLYLFWTNMIGAGLGPLIVAYMTQNVFHNKAKIGSALAIVTPVSAFLGALILWSARRAYALAVLGPSAESMEEHGGDAASMELV